MYLNALYAKGIDEIEISCKSDISNILSKETNNLLGYALVSKEKEVYIIKDISGGNYKELDEIFKRVFQMILVFYEDALKDILGEEKQTKEELTMRDLEVNKFCLFLQRAINKLYYQDAVKGRILFTYSIALEEIGDEIHRLWRTNILSKINKTKQIQEMMELNKKLLEHAFDNYYMFNSKRIESMYELREKLKNLATRTKLNGEEIIFIKCLVKIAEELVDLGHLNLMINLKEEKEIC